MKYALRLSSLSRATLPFHTHVVGEDFSNSPCGEVHDDQVSISHLEMDQMPFSKGRQYLGMRPNPRMKWMSNESSLVTSPAALAHVGMALRDTSNPVGKLHARWRRGLEAGLV